MESKDAERDRKPRRVLVGYDDSGGAKDAVRLTRMLCAGTDAEALLVSVLPWSGDLPVAYRLLGGGNIHCITQRVPAPAHR
ncbi:MAG: hypothetical protein JSS97_09455 [Actinobacteria bacterium]|nr:hypothetical protein [Actinomycetota bacterium]